ncbi:hypothetical protein ACFQY3_16875 [Paenibacillus farraposensis]|uniref:hypothetical protein n=1 Tax=Paenibacillus farraposensis TaxID=2807095 RepID=UPI00361A2FD1
MAIFYVYNFFDIMQLNVLKENATLQVFLLQGSSILIIYLIAALLKLYVTGFSFIVAPPHDFIWREDYNTKENKLVLISTLFSMVTISLGVILLYYLNPLAILLVSIFTFALSYIFSKRSDEEDARKAIEAYRERIKRVDPDGPGSVEVLAYAIGIKLNWYSGLILTILFGWLLGDVINALLAFLVLSCLESSREDCIFDL